MRVAILILTLFGLAASDIALSQAVDARDTHAFNSAIPAIAMNNPMGLAELTVGRASFGKQVSAKPAKHHALGGLTAAGAMAGRGAPLVQPLAGVRAYRQPARSWTDHLLTGVVALMLIAYQLRRKHRVLRPHPFSN